MSFWAPGFWAPGFWSDGFWAGMAQKPPVAKGGGGSGAARDDWWRSPPRKRPKRSQTAADTKPGAPIEAPLAVPDAAEAFRQALRRDAAVANATTEIERQRRQAILADDEIVLLLAS